MKLPTPSAKAFRVARVVVTLLTLLFIASRLRHLGLAEVADSLPTAWSFYALIVAGYFVTPYFDWHIYRRRFDLQPREFPLVLRKRTLNEAVLDYAGEIEFYLQMRSRPGAAATIRDVNLLSGAVSNAATIVLLIGLVIAGHLSILDHIRTGLSHSAVAAGLVTGVVLAGFGLAYRRLLTMDRANRLYVLWQHGLRLIAGLVVLVAQWAAALPHVAVGTWVLVVTVWMVVTRIPLLPSRDVLMAALGLALSGTIAASPPEVAAMFVAGACVTLLAHAAVLLVTGFAPQFPWPHGRRAQDKYPQAIQTGCHRNFTEPRAETCQK